MQKENIRVVKEFLTGEKMDDLYWTVRNLFRQGMYVKQAGEKHTPQEKRVMVGKSQTEFCAERKLIRRK